MRKTYLEIEKELLFSKKSNENLKNRVSSLRAKVLEYRKTEKSLVYQYERVVKDWQKRYENLIGNGWKLLVVMLLKKFRKGGDSKWTNDLL